MNPPENKGQGISLEGELIDLGVANNIVAKSGAWYSYEGDRIGQGKENVRQFLRENKDMATDIDQRLRAELLGSPEPEAAPEAPEEAVAE